MKNYLIDFTVIATDSESSFTTKGIYIDNCLSFTDDESNKHEIYYNEDNIQYIKTGEMSMDFTFQKDHSTIGNYELAGQIFEFEIVTTKYQVKNLSFDIQYDLYQTEKINTARIIIHAINVKEE